MSNVMLKLDEKRVRTKTVREVQVPAARIRPWRPDFLAPGEWRCADCDGGYCPDESVCKRCYGTGVPGAAYTMDHYVDIINASYEEVVDAGGERRFEDDYVHLTFETAFQTYIYPGCIFTFDSQFWKVTGVQELEDDEDDDGNLLPDRWEVIARRLEKFEGAYLFLELEDEMHQKSGDRVLMGDKLADEMGVE
jgi:hypothetical protein